MAPYTPEAIAALVDAAKLAQIDSAHRVTIASALAPFLTEPPTFCDWMKARHPHGWVVARRTPGMIAKYGERATFFTSASYAKQRSEYERETGHMA